MPYILKEIEEVGLHTLMNLFAEYFPAKRCIGFWEIEELQKLAEQMIMGVVVVPPRPITIGDDQRRVRLLVADKMLINSEDEKTVVILVYGDNIDELAFKRNDIIALSGAEVIPQVHQTESLMRAGKDLEINVETNTLLVIRTAKDEESKRRHLRQRIAKRTGPLIDLGKFSMPKRLNLEDLKRLGIKDLLK